MTLWISLKPEFLKHLLLFLYSNRGSLSSVADPGGARGPCPPSHIDFMFLAPPHPSRWIRCWLYYTTLGIDELQLVTRTSKQMTQRMLSTVFSGLLRGIYCAAHMMYAWSVNDAEGKAFVLVLDALSLLFNKPFSAQYRLPFHPWIDTIYKILIKWLPLKHIF